MAEQLVPITLDHLKKAMDYMDSIPLNKLGEMIEEGLYSPEATEDTEYDFQEEDLA